MTDSIRLAVVVPAYRVSGRILGVIGSIPVEVSRIYVVDDCCPEFSGSLVERECSDERVQVLRHELNQGVGGSVLTGYRRAMEDGMDIIIKIDGDGQMDASLI